MGFDLSAKLFYGFKLDPDSNSTVDEDTHALVHDGEFDAWYGNEHPCATLRVGWHDMVMCEAINATIRTVNGDNVGSMAAITIPPIDPAWNDQLRAWCKLYGFIYREPSWQLAALYW